MKVPFLDLRVIDLEEKHRLLKAVETVFDHGHMVMGPEIELFEQKVASFCERIYVVSVGSGTDGLYLGLRALNIGVGDEVITTSLSWIATANAIALTGAMPVFADIREDLNINPLSVSRLITTHTKAILTVNYTGKVSDIDALEKIATQNNLFLIEDGSQSFGAKYKGRTSGSFGVLSAISHNPMKVFAAIGEAGSVLINDNGLYERLVELRYNGTVNKETCMEPSLNGRMDTLQAAILLKRLEHFPELISKRRENARFYNEELQNYVALPIEHDYEQDVYYTFTIRSSRRDELKQHLGKLGVETKIQHPLLMPEQPAYRNNVRGEFLNAQRIVKQVLCIPIHEKLNEAQLDYVVKSIKSFCSSLPEPII